MTSVQLLAEVRTLLDEDVEQFWLDTECYSALSEGQKEYASAILSQYKEKLLINPNEPLPEVLKVLYTNPTQSITASTLPLPPDVLYDISVYLGTPYSQTLIKREISRNKSFFEENPYSYGDYYSIDTTNLILEIPTPTTAIDCTFSYLKKTTDISAIIEPLLPGFTHKAFVIYAFSQLLKKSKQFDTSAIQYKEFLSLIKYM